MMFTPKPHTQTYTEMARAIGADFVRAYTSTARGYYRIKLYACTGVTAAELQRLFPEARVADMPIPRGGWHSWPSMILYFDRNPF